MTKFPFMGKLNGKEALAYRDMDELQCLVCGRWFQRLATHLIQAHDIHGKDYCERYGIPWRWKGSTGLSGMAWRERQSKLMNAVPGMHERVSKIHLKSPMTGKSRKGPGKTVKQVTAETRVYKNLLICPECGKVVKAADKRSIHCSRVCALKNMPKWALAKTHCKHGHKYTQKTTRINSKGIRFCSICNGIQRRRYRERLKKGLVHA